MYLYIYILLLITTSVVRESKKL